MLCTEIVFDILNNLCSQHVLPMFCKKKRASDKDLSVHFSLASKLTIDLNMQNKNLIPKWAKMQHMLRRAVRGSHLIASGISD